MSEKLDKIKWELYQAKRTLLFSYGIRTGLIHGYEKSLIEKLRDVYYGGLPASMVLLNIDFCNGKCYDRALLLTFGLDEDEFRVIDADVDSLTLDPVHKKQYREGGLGRHYGNHRFIERTKKDGSVWVYDTSEGLVYEKGLYYKIESPKFIEVNSEQAVLDFLDYQDIKATRFEDVRDYAPLLLSLFQESIDDGKPNFYSKDLKKEIDLFKKKINSEELYRETSKKKMHHLLNVD